MEPKGYRNDTVGTQTEDIDSNSNTIAEAPFLSGKSIWTYTKPISAVMVIPLKKAEDPKTSWEEEHEDEEENEVVFVDENEYISEEASADTADLSELIPASSIYAHSVRDDATAVFREEEKLQRHNMPNSKVGMDVIVSVLPERIKTRSVGEVSATASSSLTSAYHPNDALLLSSTYKYSLAFGLLVGCFIQASSLGANYILMIVFERDFAEMAKRQNQVVTFSLGWSFLTSLMGTVILLILRSLINSAAQELNKNNLERNQPTILVNQQLSLVAFLEFPFAFGALAGVCGSWATTDFMLGLRSHAYHSLLTLVVAYIGKVIFEACSKRSTILRNDDTGHSLEDDDEEQQVVDDSSNKQALLRKTITDKHQVTDVHREFKTKGLITGLLVGFFIQFSSLGASFLMDALVTKKGTDMGSAALMSRETILAFSLGWSFVFGTMGVTILLLLRYLVGIFCEHIPSHTQGTDCKAEENEDMVDRWSVSLEFFFAVGCLIGVNIAWLVTDVGLGFNAHVWRTSATLFAAFAWCFILARCFGFRKAFGSHKYSNKNQKPVTWATLMTSGGMLIV